MGFSCIVYGGGIWWINGGGGMRSGLDRWRALKEEVMPDCFGACSEKEDQREQACAMVDDGMIEASIQVGIDPVP